MICGNHGIKQGLYSKASSSLADKAMRIACRVENVVEILARELIMENSIRYQLCD